MPEIDDWILKAKDQFNRKRYEESIVSSERAIALDEEETNGWWYLAMSHQALGNLDEALDALDKVTDLSYDFANGWAKYGAVLQALDADNNIKYDSHMSVQDSFETAVELDDEHISALTALSSIYHENNSEDPEEIDKEILVLSRLVELDEWVTYKQYNRLGILHYNNKSFFEAIKYWGINAQQGKDPASMFNLGLVYNHAEVSQDADAIDTWRLTNQLHPDYERATVEIKKLLPRLLDLSREAMDSGLTVLKTNQWYKYYINPFQLLDFKGETENPKDIDVKMIQKLRKKLFQEIELEDGNLFWMDHLNLDKSRAIQVCDELHNEKKLEYHLRVFNNKRLLGFLSRGEHRHFSVDEDWSPLKTIEHLKEKDGGFKEWLTIPFTNQFEQVIAKAIEDENISVLELLLDGRRWVAEPNTEQFFNVAREKINLKLKNLEDAHENAETCKYSIEDVMKLLKEDSLLLILNLLPTFFWEQQNKAVSAVRGIAIASNNVHGDSSLAHGILELTHEFLFKSKKHNEQVQKDFKAIEKLISEEKKHEVVLKSGDSQWKISSDGIQKGEQHMGANTVDSARWGALITETGAHDYLFAFKDVKGQQIIFTWKVTTDFEKHDKYNEDFIQAIFHYVMSSIIEKQVTKLERGEILNIGGCKLSKRGIEYQVKGFIFSKIHFVEWFKVDTTISSGSVMVRDSQAPRKGILLSIRDVDNAFILRFIKDAMI